MDKYVLRIVTLLLAVLVALSATFWVLKMVQGVPSTAPSGTTVAATATTANDAKALARALGGGITPLSPTTQAASALTASNLILQGVIAHGSKHGAALIAVNGKPAKPFVIGAAVDGDWVLQSLATRSATLKNAAGERVLELPPLSPLPPVTPVKP